MPNPPDPLIGQVLLGQYRLEDALGHGGMGTVYRATQLSIGRSVAVKVINAEAITNDQVVKRFQREAQTLSKLNHPNTVRLFDYGVTERQQPFMVMELLSGTDVSDEIATAGCIEYKRALRICLQVLRALEEAHALGVTHRDLKPSNIFLTKVPGSDVHARVLDFGIAGIAGLDQTDNDQKLTVTGLVVGSAAYMSPEQAQGQSVGPASDLYSLGAVLFEMLTGTPPFKAETLVSMLVAHITQIPPRLEVARPELPVPVAVQDILDDLLGKTPAVRPASARDVAERIEQILAGQDPASRAGVRARVAERVAMAAPEAEALVAARLEPAAQGLRPGTPRATERDNQPVAAFSQPSKTADFSDAYAAVPAARAKSNPVIYAAGGGLGALMIMGAAWFTLRPSSAVTETAQAAIPAVIAANAALAAVPANAPLPGSIAVPVNQQPAPEVAPAGNANAPPGNATPAVAPNAAPDRVSPTPAVVNRPAPSPSAPERLKAPVAERVQPVAATPTPAAPSAAVVRTPPLNPKPAQVAPVPAPAPVAPKAVDPDLSSTDRSVRRRALLRHGPRYTSVSSAKSALASGSLTRDGYEDTIWVLKQLREDSLRAAKTDYRNHKIDKETYRARVDEIEGRYRGL